MINMKKHFLIAILLFVGLTRSMAGEYKAFRRLDVGAGVDTTGPRNVIKMNLSSLALLTFSFQGEHAFNKRMSGCLGFYTITPLSIPKLFGVNDFISARFTGYSLTPEFRYYPGKKKKAAPNGFYLAPYFRYSKYTLKGSYHDNTSNFSGNLKGVTTAYGPGIMIGSQWLIGKHFSIDLFIAGIHAGKRNFKFEVQNDEIGKLNVNDKQAIINGASYLLDEYTGIDATLEDDKLLLKFNSGHWGVRGIGLNLGFAF